MGIFFGFLKACTEVGSKRDEKTYMTNKANCGQEYTHDEQMNRRLIYDCSLLMFGKRLLHNGKSQVT